MDVKGTLIQWRDSAWDNFRDDWRENALWLVCGFGLGYVARWIFG